MYSADDITVTFTEEAEWEGGLMIIAHPNGCVEVLNCTLPAFLLCATAELNHYHRVGQISHSACEFGCVVRDIDADDAR